MNSLEVQNIVSIEKLVVVVRGKEAEDAIKIAHACIQGGAKLIEITYTVNNASLAIKELSEQYKGTGVVIGAGTVLEVGVAEEAFKNGAEFIVSPDLNPQIAKYCNNNNLAYMPGVLTPTEVASALRLNCRVVKLFPGDIAMPKGLKALKGPFPKAKFMVTGGVNYDNLGDWFSAGATAVGAGSNLTAKGKQNDFQGVTNDTKLWVEKMKTF